MTTTMAGAVAGAGALDTLTRIGRLTNTRVSDRSIDGDKLRELMKAEGLPSELVPAKRAEVFDFQKACASVSARRSSKDAKGEYVEVARAKADSDECVYVITRCVKDPANRTIEHRKSMRVVYDKARRARGEDPISVEVMGAADYEALKHLEHKIRANFEIHRGKLPGSNVRAILRAVFAKVHATRWSTTNSVWFVPEQHASTIEAMERVLKALYGLDDVEFDSIPLYKEDTGDIVERKVISHVRTDVSKLMAENAERLRGGDKIKQTTFERAREEREKLDGYAREMVSVVGGELDAVKEAMRLLDDQLVAMFGRVGA
jgi:hypothetical protein